MPEKTLRLTFTNLENENKDIRITFPRCDDTKTGGQIKTAADVFSAKRGSLSSDIGVLKKIEWVTPTIYTDVPIPI